MVTLHELPGKLVVRWVPEVRAVLDTWTNYAVTLDEFREAVGRKGLAFGKANGVRAWIVDSSSARGAFPSEIQDYIDRVQFPEFVQAGVKYFITITAASAITRLTVADYSAKAGPNGLRLVEADSAAGAVEWLRAHAG